jgi:hypothetical protein
MPFRRKDSAVARPIPLAAPVIAAVSPARMRGSLAMDLLLVSLADEWPER